VRAGGPFGLGANDRGPSIGLGTGSEKSSNVSGLQSVPLEAAAADVAKIRTVPCLPQAQPKLYLDNSRPGRGAVDLRGGASFSDRGAGRSQTDQ